jgi:anti-sigma B factor antagonist
LRGNTPDPPNEKREGVAAVDAVELELRGEIDVDVSEVVRERVLQRVRDAAGRPLEIDMAEVSFIDSSGVSALVAGLRLARGHGGSLRLVNVGSQIRRIFEVTGLADQFGVDGQA